MARSTSLAPAPRLQAEPVDTAKPAALRRVSHFTFTGGGTVSKTVFHSRGLNSAISMTPGRTALIWTSNPWRAEIRSPANAVRPDSTASHAASIAATAGRFSVPARRRSSCGPPRSERKGRPPSGTLRNPIPFGPPNLWALPVRKSHAPSPADGSLPIHCAASQCSSAPCLRHKAKASCQGCSTPVSLLAAITATRPGRWVMRISSNDSRSSTPLRVTGISVRESRKQCSAGSLTQGCSMALMAMERKPDAAACATTALLASVAPDRKMISSAPHPRRSAIISRQSSSRCRAAPASR